MDNESLYAFIMRRRLEIEEGEAMLRKSLASLLLEKAQLHRAAIAAGIVDKPAPGSEKPRRGPRPKNGTIKQAVIEILTVEGRGMLAIELRNRLNERNGTTLIRSSLSPQLSRLKQEGILVLTDNYWHLPSQKIEPPDNTLFAKELSEGSKPDHEAQDVKATSGGGT